MLNFAGNIFFEVFSNIYKYKSRKNSLRVSILKTAISRCKNMKATPQMKAAKKLAKPDVQIFDASWNSIPKELRHSFTTMYAKDGKRFLKKTYKALVKYMDLEGIAPKKIEFKKYKTNTLASFNEILNTISYSKEDVNVAFASSQVNSLAHELKHCKQSVDLLRSPSVGLEVYVKAISDRIVDKKVRNLPNDVAFEYYYKKAQQNGNVDQFVNNEKTKYYNLFLRDVRKNFSKAIKMPKVEETASQKRIAEVYLKALRNYVNASEDQIEYRYNLRELEAYDFGDQIEQYYKIFERLCSRIAGQYNH